MPANISPCQPKSDNASQCEQPLECIDPLKSTDNIENEQKAIESNRYSNLEGYC